MDDLWAFLYLAKCPKTEQIDNFSPRFHQNFSMIILSNIFKNERFQNGRNLPFFSEKLLISGVLHEITQKLLELELLLEISYSATFV